MWTKRGCNETQHKTLSWRKRDGEGEEKLENWEMTCEKEDRTHGRGERK